MEHLCTSHSKSVLIITSHSKKFKIAFHSKSKFNQKTRKKATTKRVWIRPKHSAFAAFTYKRIKMKKSINQTRGASAECYLYEFGSFSFASNFFARIITKIKYVKTTGRLRISHLKSRKGASAPPAGAHGKVSNWKLEFALRVAVTSKLVGRGQVPPLRAPMAKPPTKNLSLLWESQWPQNLLKTLKTNFTTRCR